MLCSILLCMKQTLNGIAFSTLFNHWCIQTVCQKSCPILKNIWYTAWWQLFTRIWQHASPCAFVRQAAAAASNGEGGGIRTLAPGVRSMHQRSRKTKEHDTSWQLAQTPFSFCRPVHHYSTPSAGPWRRAERLPTTPAARVRGQACRAGASVSSPN